jgi:hypothetical protein
MPPSLSPRQCDNWRPLIAIADALNVGEEARQAAVTLCVLHNDQDIPTQLLVDIRVTFNRQNINGIWVTSLVNALIDLDDAAWAEFRGQKNDGAPHPLRQTELKAMLRSFKIRTKSVWCVDPQTSRPVSRKGYTRSQFEPVWEAYCPKTGNPAGSSNIRYLDRQ